MSTIITDTDTLALLIRSEVKKGISPLMEAGFKGDGHTNKEVA